MTTNLKAIYENGVLRLKEPLALPDGAQVDVTVVLHEEDNDERSKGMDDHSWDALTQLFAKCAIDTGIPDFARNHDRYLCGTRAPSKGGHTIG
jgi:predicted DNA-binding antitoxin AbrB/MazE fold protein